MILLRFLGGKLLALRLGSRLLQSGEAASARDQRARGGLLPSSLFQKIRVALSVLETAALKIFADVHKLYLLSISLSLPLPTVKAAPGGRRPLATSI